LHLSPAGRHLGRVGDEQVVTKRYKLWLGVVRHLCDIYIKSGTSTSELFSDVVQRGRVRQRLLPMCHRRLSVSEHSG
jgi:hypothetical protein